MATNYPEVMTIDEVCQYLRIPRSSLYKLAQEGKMPCPKVGRHWRFHRTTLINWIAGQRLDESGISVQAEGLKRP